MSFPAEGRFASQGPRRIRGGAAVGPDTIAWREQRRAQARPVVIDQAAVDAPVRSRLGLETDGVFAFLLLLPLLFIAQIGALGAAMFAGLTCVYLVVRRQGLTHILMVRAFLFLIPAFAFLSVVWSEAPSETFKFSIELTLTILAGLLLSSAPRQTSVLRGLTLAFLIYVAAAIVNGGRVGIGVGAGGEAFSGLTSSKNLLADIASTGFIVSIATLMLAVRDRAWPWVALAALGAALDIYAVAGARSAGALLGLGMAIGAISALSPLVLAGRLLRGALTAAVGLSLFVGGLFYRTLSTAMIEFGANLFDKDPTLTGRTYLWYRAADLIREQPLLGRGYYAFWRQGNTDAEGLWRYFGIDSRGGFTFHNTLVDILVTLGWIGVGLIVTVVIIGAIALVRRFVKRPTLALVFWIALFLYQLARTPIETIGIAPFYFSTVLAFAALGAAFSRSRERVAPVPRSPRPAVPVSVWTLRPESRAGANAPRETQRLLPRNDPP